MSAWIVEKAHIDALVQSLIVEGLIDFDQADDVGHALWHENHLSIEARYGDPPDTPEYTFEGIEAKLDPAKVRTLVRCYDYQTCEHAAWEPGVGYDEGTDMPFVSDEEKVNPMRRLMVELERKVVLTYANGDAEAMDRELRNRLNAQGKRYPWGISQLAEALP